MTVAWHTVRIGDFGKIVTGKTPSSERPDEFGDAYPFITPSDIDKTSKFANTERYLSDAGASTLGRARLPANTVCVVCIGATIGKVVMTDRPSFTNQQINSVIVDRSRFDPNYVFYLCKAIAETFQVFAGGAATPIINKTVFSSITVRVPELSVQQKIAAVLCSLDDLIDNNQRRIALLESMAEEIYREWFVRMRCPVDTETNKSSKRLRQFDSLCELQRGFDLPDSDMQPGTVPVIASTTIKGFHNVAKVKPPVITTGRSGSLGTVLYVREPAWPLNTSLWVKDFKGNSPNLVYFTLRGLHLENFNAGAGVPTLNRNHLKSIKVRIPTPASQSKFDELVEPILAQAQTLRLACAKLVSTRDALLPRLISGKLRVDALDIKFPPSMQQPPEEMARATSIEQGLVHSGA